MKITIKIDPKEIADLAVKGQGQPASNSKTVDNEVEIFITNSRQQGVNGYCWSWGESFEKNVFGWKPSLDEVYKKAKSKFPNNKIVLKFI